jgi:hypothetical protein
MGWPACRDVVRGKTLRMGILVVVPVTLSDRDVEGLAFSLHNQTSRNWRAIFVDFTRRRGLGNVFKGIPRCPWCDHLRDRILLHHGDVEIEQDNPATLRELLTRYQEKILVTPHPSMRFEHDLFQAVEDRFRRNPEVTQICAALRVFTDEPSLPLAGETFVSFCRTDVEFWVRWDDIEGEQHCPGWIITHPISRTARMGSKSWGWSFAQPPPPSRQ